MKKFILHIINKLGYRIEKNFNDNNMEFYAQSNHVILNKIEQGRILYQLNDFSISLRKLPSSDYEVLKQVLIKEEYAFVKSFFKLNNIIPKIMIDAGANIGLTSIYFKNTYKDLQIFCIEPEWNNFKQLTTNIENNRLADSVKVYRAGLMGVENIPLKIGSEFRDHNDWAKQTLYATDDESDIKSITIPQIMHENNIEYIDLLKIDIEGAETFLLEKETETNFLDKTKCIAIEVHDEYDCRTGIYQLLKARNFILCEYGETTMGINTNLL